MDKLAREAMLAKQACMSYGKWKAMQEPVPIKKQEIPEGWKKCPGCGKAFNPHDVRQIYCDVLCRNSLNSKKHRQKKEGKEGRQ